MSRMTDAAGQNPPFKSFRTESKGRRRANGGLFGTAQPSARRVAAVVERLEDRALLASVNLTLSLETASTRVLADGSVSYTLKVVNPTGSVVAKGLRLTSTFTLVDPTNNNQTIANKVDLVSSAKGPSNPSPTGPITSTKVDGALVVSVGFTQDVPVIDAATNTFTITVKPAIEGTLQAKVAASVTAPDTIPANNSPKSANDVQVAPLSRLNLTNTYLPTDAAASPLRARVGENTTFQISVMNTGPSDATDLKVENIIRLVDANNMTLKSLSLVSATKDSANPAASDITTEVQTDGTVKVTIQFSERVLAGGLANKFNVVVNASAVGMLQRSLTTSVTSPDGVTPVTVNSLNLNVVSESSIALSVVPPTSASSGQDAIYTFTVVNNGPSPAINLNLAGTFKLNGVTDQSILEIKKVESVGGVTDPTISSPGQPLSLVFGRMNSRSSYTFTVRFKPTASGTLKSTLTANVPAPGNNTGDRLLQIPDVTVAPVVRLAITLSPPTVPDSFKAGDSATFRVTVKNTGLDEARNIRLTDTFTLTKAGQPNRNVLITNFRVEGTNTYDIRSPLSQTNPTAVNSLLVTFTNPLPAGAEASFIITVQPQGNGSLTSAASARSTPVNQAGAPAATTPVPVLDPGTIGFEPGVALSQSETRTNTKAPEVTVHVTRNTFTNTSPVPGSIDGTASIVLSLAVDPGDTTRPANTSLVEGVDFDILVDGVVKRLKNAPLTLDFDAADLALNPNGTIKDDGSVEITIRLKTTNGFSPPSKIVLTLSNVVNARAEDDRLAFDLTVVNNNSLVVTNSDPNSNDPGSLNSVLSLAKDFGQGKFAVPISFDLPGNQFEIKLTRPLKIDTSVLINGNMTRSSGIVKVRFTKATNFDGTKAYGDSGLVFVDGSAFSTLQSVEVTGFGGNGVTLDTSNITVRSSDIFGNDGDGIFVTENGTKGTIGGVDPSGVNTIYGNKGYGIRVGQATVAGDDANPVTVLISRNLLGLRLSNAGTRVTSVNQEGELILVNATDFLVLDNTIQTKGSLAGIQINASRRTNIDLNASRIAGNSINGESGTGIQIGSRTNTSNSGLQILDNVIKGSDADFVGLRAFGGSGNSISGNAIGGVTDAGTIKNGIELDGANADYVLDSNEISGTTDAGILVLSGSNAKLLNGTIVGRGGSGIVASGGEGLFISRVVMDGISSGLVTGILLRGNVSGTQVEFARITLLKGHGILVVGDDRVGPANTTIRTSFISGSGGDGIHVTGTNVNTTIQSNTLVMNARNGIGLIEADGVKIFSNFIGVDRSGEGFDPNSDPDNPVSFGNQRNGVFVDHSDDVVIGMDGSPNLISQSTFNGVEVLGSVRVTIEGNYLGTDTLGRPGLNNGRDGILVRDASHDVKILKNVLSKSRLNGIEIVDSDRPEVDTNRIGVVAGGNALDGLVLIDSEAGMISGNIFANSGKVGLRAGGTSAIGLTIANNTFTTNAEGGVWVDGRGSTTLQISDNTIIFNGTSAASAGDPEKFAGLEVKNAPGLILAMNRIGTDGKDSVSVGNEGRGALITSSAGAKITDNTISGNALTGLVVNRSDDVMISNNRIGVGSGANNNPALGNQDGGVRIGGSNRATIQGNVISSNASFGLLITSTDDLGTRTVRGVNVLSNQIGTDSNARLARGNQGIGLHVEFVSDAMIRSNVISANADFGLKVNDADNPTIDSNFIGTGSGRTERLGNAGGGVYLLGTSGTKILENTIVDNGALPGSTTNGLTIENSRDPVSSPTLVEHNFIGTNADLSPSLGNIGSGIRVLNADSVVILRNFLSSNTRAGLYATGSDDLVVQGNTIGGARRNDSLGNGQDGIHLEDSDEARIDRRNVISGNGRRGIFVESGSDSGSDNVRIQDNIIGLDLSQRIAIGNADDGVQIRDGSGSIVIGNRIAANVGDGIEVSGLASGIILSTNLVGDLATNAVGGVFGNKGEGIFLARIPGSPGSDSVILKDNQVKGNARNGIRLGGASHVRFIGVNITRENLQDGIALETLSETSAQDEEIKTESRVNTIRGVLVLANKGHGIHISDSSNNTILATTIVANQGDGIHIDGASAGNVISGANRIGLDDKKLARILQPNAQSPLDSLVQIDEAGEVTLKGSARNLGTGVALVSSITTGTDVMGNTIKDNVILASNGSGVLLSGKGVSGNLLTGNDIGGPDGLVNRGDGVTILDAGADNRLRDNKIFNNDNNGVLISETNGTRVTGNDILANGNNGVLISQDADTRVAGNTINENGNFGLFLNDSTGTDVDGQTIVGNKSHGIVILLGGGNRVSGSFLSTNELAGVLLLNTTDNTIGGDIPGRENTITGNKTDGVAIFDGSANRVQGNFIGIDAGSAMQPEEVLDASKLGNFGDGVHIVNSRDNFIYNNKISANQQSGIEIFGTSTGNLVYSNFLGTLSSNSGQLGNKLNGVLISGSDPNGPIGSPGSNDPVTRPSNNIITQNFIAGNQANGIAVNLADSNIISGNLIGTLAAPGARGNALAGISVTFSTNTVISDLNQVSGNTTNGIEAILSDSTKILGNAISGNRLDGVLLDQTDVASLANNFIGFNQGDGIRLQNGSDDNFIGAVGAGNTILKNAVAGVEISTQSTGNLLLGNKIGFGAKNVIGGNAIGVVLDKVQGNIIGGASLDEGANTITGNRFFGVEVVGNGPAQGGNTIQSNFIGTDDVGETPGAFPDGTADIGVYLINSASNGIFGNVISGNHQAGIALFGEQSKTNLLSGNTIGSNRSFSGPIMTKPDKAVTVYAPLLADGVAVDDNLKVRQTYGVWIIGGPNNLVGAIPQANIPGNTIQGNEIGVLIQGGTAVNNTLFANLIGSTLPEADLLSVRKTYTPNTNGLGNLFGVYIANTNSNSVLANTISRNVSVGMAIVGQAATGNTVQANVIQGNGGYADRDTLVNTKFLVLEPYTSGDRALVLGSGVYIESGQGNIIGINIGPDGSAKDRQDPAVVQAQANMILDNTQVGVYVFNFGPVVPRPNPNPALGNTVSANSIAGNTISDLRFNGAGPRPEFTGDYGILLFNSSGNIPGVPRIGVSSNNFKPTLGQPRIARFREYTGPGEKSPFTTLPDLPPTGRGKVSARSASVRAASINGVPVTIETGGKGHPLPPGRKNSGRKS